MGRPRQATPEQEAEIRRLHDVEGLGTLRIAKAMGLRRGLVWRVLHRDRPSVALLGGSPQKALPGGTGAQKLLPPDDWRKRVYPLKPAAIPPAQEIAAPIGKCPLCEKDGVALVGGLGMCSECLASELTWKSRPVGVGLCWRCGRNPAALHEWEDSRTRESGLCASCRRGFVAAALRDPPPPRRDADGLWWDSDAAGGRGAWKA
jgi:hypothetical protein